MPRSVGVMLTVHTRLAEAGIAVYGYDHHGHGESEPKAARERALVHDFNHLVCIPAQILLGTQRPAWWSKCSSCKPHRMILSSETCLYFGVANATGKEATIMHHA
jgi:alpha-beta hydrolase superfamily lysophospholipase